MLTNADPKHWGANPEVFDYLVSAFCADARSILDIGPGPHASLFPPATHAVDFKVHSFPGVESVSADFRKDRLPYPDRFFDFVHCRHVVEDLDDPLWLCREMMRVGRRGYIETPSPLAELCRGIDAQSPPWRGYYHHRHFVYATPGKLTFLAKSPRVEHDPVDDAKIAATLRAEPLLWNTYFLWEGSFEVEFVSDALLQGYWDSMSGKPFGPGYPERVLEAVNIGIASTLAFARNIHGTAPAEVPREREPLPAG